METIASLFSRNVRYNVLETAENAQHQASINMAHEIKTIPTSASVVEFIESGDPTRKNDSFTLINMMRDISGCDPVMWGSAIIGFGSYRYTYASGREGDWMRIGFSPRKEAFSLYLSCDADEFADELSRLGKHKRGKGCIYIGRLADINESALRSMVVKAWEATEQN